MESPKAHLLSLLVLFTFLTLVLVSARGQDTGASQIDDFVAALSQGNSLSDPAVRRSFLAQQFESFSSSHGRSARCPRSASTDELHAMFKAARSASFYEADAPYFERAEACYEQLVRRNATSRAEDLEMYEVYVRHRALDEARQFARSHPELEQPEIPRLSMSFRTTEPSVIAIERGASAVFNQERVSLQQPAQLVVVSSAMCQFSKAAIEAIEADPALVQDIASALWVSPVNDLTSYQRIMDWNSSHPSAQLKVAYADKAFGKIDLSRTPAFYFMKDGKIVNELVGWPSQERLTELKSYLEDLKLGAH